MYECLLLFQAKITGHVWIKFDTEITELKNQLSIFNIFYVIATLTHVYVMA